MICFSNSYAARGSYVKYTDADRAEIGKYSRENSTAATLKKFRTRYPNLNESTVRGMRSAYDRTLASLKRQHGGSFNPDVHKVKEIRKQTANYAGRPLKLGDLDAKVMEECKKVRQSGGVLNGLVLRAIATAVIRMKAPEATIDLGRGWTNSMFKRLGYSMRHATTGKLQLPEKYVTEKQYTFLRDIALPVRKYSIDRSLIINWDQTPLQYAPTGQWTMEKTGESKVAINGMADKRNITAVLSVALDGTFLPPQLIYTGLTARSQPTVQFPENFHVTQNAKHWSNEDTMIQFLENIILPYVEQRRTSLNKPDMPALLIFDCFKPHMVQSVVQKMTDNNCIFVKVPENMTDYLQPLDVGINKPVKDFFRNKFCSWYTEQVMGGLEYEELAKLFKSGVALRERHAAWIIDMFNCFQHKREMVVNAFKRVGIPQFLELEDLNDDPFI